MAGSRPVVSFDKYVQLGACPSGVKVSPQPCCANAVESPGDVRKVYSYFAPLLKRGKDRQYNQQKGITAASTFPKRKLIVTKQAFVGERIRNTAYNCSLHSLGDV